ncbi:MAG: hypothetical protein JNM17_00790 [Archangium sp.]|nr:hypothetical protein [Archangium sp.]
MRVSLLMGCVLAFPAFAGALDDLRAGSGVDFLTANARFGDSGFAAGAWSVAKAPGSLNLTARLSDFGLPQTDLVTLTGAASGDVVTWSFDHHLSSPVSVADVRVTRVWGQFVARAAMMSGSVPCGGSACARNVRLVPVPGSAVHLGGYRDWGLFTPGWSADVEVVTFSALAGLPRPVFESISLPLPASRCASSERVRLEGSVTLQTPAPSTGASVTVSSTHPAVWARDVRVVAGSRTARFSVTLAAGFTGSARVVASAGGASGSVLIDRVACFTFPWPNSVVFPPLLGTPRALLPSGALVLATATSDVILEGQTLLEPAKSSVLKNPRVASIAGGELLLGSSDGAQVWNATVGVGPVAPGVQPLAVLPGGVALVRDGKGALAQLDGVGLRALPALAGVEVTSVHANALGELAAGLVSGQQVVPALLTFEGVKVLSTLPGEAMAVLADGTVFGHAGGKAFRKARAATQLSYLPLPQGCSSARVSVVNESGWVAGDAQCSGKTMAWLASPQGLVKRVDQLVTVKGVEPREVLGLSELNTVLVRGVNAQGASVFFLVTP